jgi:hypothetical protein
MRCVRCGNKLPIARLQCSHYFGRTILSVRWDEANCDALCYGCHRYWEKEDREGYRVFKIKQLGERGYILLQIRAHTLDRSLDERIIALYYKQQLLKKGVSIPKDLLIDRLTA